MLVCTPLTATFSNKSIVHWTIASNDYCMSFAKELWTIAEWDIAARQIANCCNFSLEILLLS
jgi:hypothetical protein